MNTGALWPGLLEAESRVLTMQTKLHQWAMVDFGRRFRRHEHMESRMRWESHVRFGGRVGETHRSKDGRALRSDPYTRLLGPTKWTYFYLYVVLDIFSRYAVGWMVADRENSALAACLLEETCHKQGVRPQVLTLHSDRGAPMTSKCTAQLLADLGVTRSLSRPQVSDDNPFSEAQFKTLKYHPGFPGRFHNITAAIAFCRTFFPWYNTEHRHGGIAMLTPDECPSPSYPERVTPARADP